MQEIVNCFACEQPLPVARTAVADRWWVQCAHCGSSALTPLASSRSADLYSEADYCRYLSADESLGEALYFEDRLASLGVSKSAKILDFGAGRCQYQAILEDRRWSDVWSYEINAALVQTAAVRLTMPARATGTWTDLELGAFDAIVCNMVLEHVDDPAQVLREQIVPLLRPGGVLIATMPHSESMNRSIVGLRWIGYSVAEHNWFLSRRGASCLLLQAGLHEIETTTRSLLFTRFDGWRPHGLVKQTYKATVMRFAEWIGRGDAIMFVGRSRD